MCKNKNNVNQDIITNVIKEFPNSVKNRESAMIHDCASDVASHVESEFYYPNIAIEACKKLLVELQEYKDRCIDIRMRELLENKLIDSINKLKDTNITEDDSNENKCLISDYYDAVWSLGTKIIYLEDQELDCKISDAYQEFFKTFVDVIKYL